MEFETYEYDKYILSVPVLQDYELFCKTHYVSWDKWERLQMVLSQIKQKPEAFSLNFATNFLRSPNKDGVCISYYERLVVGNGLNEKQFIARCTFPTFSGDEERSFMELVYVKKGTEQTFRDFLAKCELQNDYEELKIPANQSVMIVTEEF